MNDLQNKRTEFKDSLKKFVLENNIIGTVAGFSIALVTKDAIQSLVNDVIIPGFVFLLLKLNIQSVTKVLPVNEHFQITNFIKDFISWFLVLIITFLFVKFAFEGLLGINEDSINNTSETQKQQQLPQQQQNQSVNKKNVFLNLWDQHL